ncbi:MAG: zinc-dependent metalloprotease [Sphingomicrobium sp.]
MLTAIALAPATAATPRPKAPVAAAEKSLFAIAADRDSGKIIATFPKPAADGIAGRYIYVSQLESGIGSAPLAMDFSQNSGGRLLVFRRVGKKVVAEVENPRFIASSADTAGQAGIARDFARSVIWTGDVVKTNADGSFTVDLASFAARDDLGIGQGLKDSKAGDYALAADLSVADPASVRAFPRNVEMSATLTFRASEPGAELRNILPAANLSVRVRHSLIELPKAGYVPRTDLYGYAIAQQVLDASAPLGQPMFKDVVLRFRLAKKDPSAARSEVVDPIVFYIDPAAPQPVRQALVDGVGWWSEAFDAAGLVNAFQVRELPVGADPLDVRYNVVNWVNRATRGWSYGGMVADPRTGESIKGGVVLGSLRVRQDILIFQALVGANLTGTGDPNDPITAALARIRQLGAHEVGHALGFQHNFASSTQDRYSVMDYPPPRISFDGGAIGIADAYGKGIGIWDKFLVAYVYGAMTDREAAPIVADARRRGLRFVADSNARPNGSGHPEGGIWDDGANPIAELSRVSAIRRAALNRFGYNSVPAGAPASELRRAFVPVWLLDRYQVEAAAKSLGGVDYAFALAGEAPVARVVPAAQQRAALGALLATLDEAALTVPAHLLPMLTSGSGDDDYQSMVDQLPTAGRDMFDPLKASEIGAVQTLNAMLDPARLNRLAAQNAADPGVPSPLGVADSILGRVMGGNSAVQRRIATTAVLAIARAARSSSLSPAVALQLDARLIRLADQLERAKGGSEWGDWEHGLAALLKDREALDKAIADPARLPQVPPGMPI